MESKLEWKREKNINIVSKEVESNRNKNNGTIIERKTGT